MRIFEKAGYLHIAWGPGSGMMFEAHGDTADVLLALASGIKEVIESAVPPEHRMDCARELTDLLLEMMQAPVTKIDLGAMMKGGARHE